MPFREKLKSLIHRHDNDDESTSTPNSPRQSRSENGVNSQRPISGSDQQSQPTSARSRSSIRRSFDRKSAAAATGSDSANRRSIDASARKSLDQRQIDAGVAPKVPQVPDTYKGQAAVARPVISQDAETQAAKESARRSSHVMNYNHSHSNSNSAALPVATQSDKYSQDRNMPISEQSSFAHAPAPLNVAKTSAVGKSRQSSSSSNNSIVPGLDKAAHSRKSVGGDGYRNSRDVDSSRKNRLSMDKPLPPAPQQSALSEDPALSQFLPKDHNYVVRDAPATPSLAGVVDLGNSVDTDVTETWAPAVVHETIQKEVHHITEEIVTREIHNHDVYHRILPIIDIEVLPARHFVPTGNGDELMEISADEIPGRTGYNQQWFVGEMLSKLPKDSNFGREPLRFTAREFPGTEGDYKEYVNKGVPTTETTWIHPPTFDDTMFLAGQTEAFHFGSSNPADDGLRIRAPNGKVVGSSRYHKVQLERRVEAVEESMKKLSVGGERQQTGLLGRATGQEGLTKRI